MEDAEPAAAVTPATPARGSAYTGPASGQEGKPMPKPPLLFKHDLMKHLERLAERPEKVRTMLERLRNHESARVLAERLVANGLCSQEAADRMVAGWGGDEGIMHEVWTKLGETAEQLERDRDLKLDMWWAQIEGQAFEISVELRGRKLRVMLWTDHVPDPTVLAKRAYDPAYLEELRNLKHYVEAILSLAEAAQG
jgi:hypothetical protein